MTCLLINTQSVKYSYVYTIYDHRQYDLTTARSHMPKNGIIYLIHDKWYNYSPLILKMNDHFLSKLASKWHLVEDMSCGDSDGEQYKIRLYFNAPNHLVQH